MRTLRGLTALALMSGFFATSASAATLSFNALILDNPLVSSDSAFIGEVGTGTLEYEDHLVSDSGPSLLQREDFSFTVDLFDQMFTDLDVSGDLPEFAIFSDGALAALALVIAEEIYPNPPQIDRTGVKAIGVAPFAISTDASGAMTIGFWVNAAFPDDGGFGPIPTSASVPLPGSLVLAGGGLALLAGLRARRRLTK